MKETKLSVADSFEILFQPLSIEDRQELENKLVTENNPQIEIEPKKQEIEL